MIIPVVSSKDTIFMKMIFEKNHTALMIAVKKNNSEMIKMLLEAGAKAEAADFVFFWCDQLMI